MYEAKTDRNLREISIFANWKFQHSFLKMTEMLAIRNSTLLVRKIYIRSQRGINYIIKFKI